MVCNSHFAHYTLFWFSMYIWPLVWVDIPARHNSQLSDNRCIISYPIGAETKLRLDFNSKLTKIGFKGHHNRGGATILIVSSFSILSPMMYYYMPVMRISNERWIVTLQPTICNYQLYDCYCIYLYVSHDLYQNEITWLSEYRWIDLKYNVNKPHERQENHKQITMK